MNVSNEDILAKLTDVHTEVKLTNGRVTKNERAIKDHQKKLEAIEKTDVFEEGYRTGKKSMKTSTKNTIYLALIIAGFIITATTFGVREIRHYKSGQISHLEKQLSKAEVYFNNHEPPVTKGLPWNSP